MFISAILLFCSYLFITGYCQEEDCGGTLLTTSGQIKLPSYQAYQICEWILKPKYPHNLISLEFDGYFEIDDSLTGRYSTRGGHLFNISGLSRPIFMNYEGNTMIIKFIAGSSDNLEGFELKYEYKYPTYPDPYGIPKKLKYSAAEYTLYEDKDFVWCAEKCGTGEKFGISATGCMNFNFYTDRVSSIDPHDTCLLIWEDRECSGRSEIIGPTSPHHGDLSLLKMNNDSEENWDNRLSSISGCSYLTETDDEEYLKELYETSELMNRISLEDGNHREFDDGAFDPSEIHNILYISIVSIFLISGTIIIVHFISKQTKDPWQDQMEMIEEGNHTAIGIIDWPQDIKILRIPKEDLDFENNKLLDEGNFGRVFSTVYKKSSKVILKTTKDPKNSNQLEYLRQELKILSKLGSHLNIVGFIGACLDEQNNTLHIVAEYCEMGSVENYIKLHKNRFKNFFSEEFNPNYTAPLSTLDLVRWSYQIASGMHYLEDIHIIHGDLATRNVLLFSRECAKITDFGLSKNLYFIGNNYYRWKNDKNKPLELPLAWLSLETMFDLTLSTESDIWSYGVTLWELFSLSDAPYGILTNNVEKFMDKVKNGHRLEKPKYSNDLIYREILKCWHKNPNQRPKFEYLKEFFYNLHRNENFITEINLEERNNFFICLICPRI